MALPFAIATAVLLATGTQPARVAHDSAYAVTWDTTYYVTNRARAGFTLSGTRSDSLEYGFVVTRYRERADRPFDTSWLAGFSAQQGAPVRLTRDEFIARVGATDARAARGDDGPVVYVHGFAVSFRRAIAQGSEIAHRGRFGGAFVVFAWPAHRAIAAWPSPSALVSRAYREDSVTAGASTGAFRGALADLFAAVPASRITVVAHSMGAQLASEALAAPTPFRDLLRTAPLRALALFAPDIAAPRFRDSLDLALVPVAARRVIYASQADRMLTISRLVNHSPRAGQAGGERLLAASDVEIVDVTQGLRADGALRKLVEPRHAMRYASSALRDFFGVVRGASSDCRAIDGLAERTGDRSWRLTSALLPAHDVACGRVAAGDSTVRQPQPR